MSGHELLPLDQGSRAAVLISAQIAARRKQGVPAGAEDMNEALKAMLDPQIAGMPELGRMTSDQAATMTDLAPVPHDSGVMRGNRAIAGGRRLLRHVLHQATLAATYHDPTLMPVAQRLMAHGKSHKFTIVAIARRLITIANAILKTSRTCRQLPAT